MIPTAKKSLVFTVSPWQMSAMLHCIDLVLRHSHRRVSMCQASRSNVDPGEGMKQPKGVQQPQNHNDNHYAIQNGLDGCLHRNKAIHQPQENTHHNHYFDQLN
jgi:hypothetical protein